MWARILGSAVLGCIGGVLAMIVLNDLVAGIWPEAVLIIAPLSLPVGAFVGAGMAGAMAYRRIARSR